MRVDKGSLSIVLLLCLAGTAFSASIKVDDRQTIYLAEMEAQAAAAFDRLDRDRDKTLDYGEVRGHLGKKAFIAADPDKDTTLTKEEYVEMAEKLFKAADTDSDGVLDARELRSLAGQALLRLLQ